MRHETQAQAWLDAAMAELREVLPDWEVLCGVAKTTATDGSASWQPYIRALVPGCGNNYRVCVVPPNTATSIMARLGITPPRWEMEFNTAGLRYWSSKRPFATATTIPDVLQLGSAELERRAVEARAEATQLRGRARALDAAAKKLRSALPITPTKD